VLVVDVTPDTQPTQPLLGRSYQLPDGPRIHLRLARRRDATGVSALLASDRSADDEPTSVREFVHFDPRYRAVACATALIDGSERVVGIGAITLGASEPDLVLVDAACRDALPDLLHRALVGRSRSSAELRAA
jgi:hypothetical protein